MKNRSSVFYAVNALMALSACSIPLGAETDMQGIDPNAYYAQHPIVNKVETRQLSQLVHFTPAAASLPDEDAEQLRVALHVISPQAVDSITIRLAQGDQLGLARENAVTKLLGQMGYGKINVQFKPSAAVARGTAMVDVAYLAVVSPPNCPDWRMSPVTSHSNTQQGNFQCATTTDIGLMIADPHDLARGTGDVAISTERSSSVLTDYNTNKDYMPNTLNAGTTGNGGSSGSSGSSSGSSSGGSGSGGSGGSGGGGLGGSSGGGGR